MAGLPSPIGIDGLKLQRPRTSPWLERLWREWCFVKVVWAAFRLRAGIMVIALLTGATLFRWLEPEKQHSFARGLYYTWSLVFGEPPEEFPDNPILQLLFFLMPIVGMLVILEGIVEFALILRDRQRNEHIWCKVMASALKDHVILIGLGKLGYRSYRWLRTLDAPCVVIESNPQNQFLEEIRRDGIPLLIGDARREQILVDANAAGAKSIILATNNDLVNLEAALDARKLNPTIRVVLRLFDQNMADKIRDGFNIKIAMSQSAISAPAFVMAAVESSIVSSMVVGGELVVMQRWYVQAEGPLSDRTIGEVMTEFGVNVVERQPWGGGSDLFPPPDTKLHSGDELLVQGKFDTLSEMREKTKALTEKAV